ncbi:MAG TPA: ferredoxin reductase [Anaerolineaceae bacterium]
MKRALEWQAGTLLSVRAENGRVKTFTFALPDWQPHRAGQHYDLRLTAPDGYQAQRSYSIASPPEQAGQVALTVEKIDDGEVSAYMHEVMQPGDQIEMRGPIGGYFVWEASLGGPLLLIGGGSGVVPLMAMIRHREAAGSRVPTRLLYSVRSPDDVIYQEELGRLASGRGGLDVLYTYTRSAPPGWQGYARRIDAPMLAEALRPLGSSPRIYICGPTLLVENAADCLVQLGVPPAQIRTERFGPAGGTS